MADIPWRIVGFDTFGLVAGISSGLDSLPNGGLAITSAITNANGWPFLSLRVYAAPIGVANPSNGSINVYLLPSMDGSAYTYGDGSTAPPRSALVASLDSYNLLADEATYRFCIPAPASGFKLLVENKTGGALASSGNVFYYTLHGYGVPPL